jgi:hypothetical protein
MSKLVTSCLAALLFVGAAMPIALAGDKVNVPDWVRQTAAKPIPVYPPDTDAVVLEDAETYTVTGPTEYIRHHRRVVKILRPSGIEQGSYGVHFRSDEKVISVHGWSIDSAGHEYELKDKEFEERAWVSAQMYDDVRYRLGTVPGSQVGSVVAFESEVRRHTFLDEFTWTPQEDNPVLHGSITIQLPSGYEFKDSWFGIPSSPPSSPSANSWRWEAFNLAPIKQEEHMPAFGALAGRLKLNYFGPGLQSMTDSWNALGNWYNRLTFDRRVSTPEISQKVSELTAGKSDFVSKVRAITNFMQSEIRYVAIEIGVGGYQPHAATDIFRARYGDCKDKATLLSTMLHEAGVASDYVIIHTGRGVVKPDIPSSWFNHAILAIELPANANADTLRAVISDKAGKKYLLFDPTNPFTPLGEIPSYLQDSYALLVKPSGGEIIRTPVLDPAVNRYVRHGDFKLSADGTLEGSVEGKMIGNAASENRHLYSSLSELERKQVAERYIMGFLKSAALKDLKVDALDRNSDELVIRYGLTSERYAQVAGPLLIVRPRVLGQYAFALEKKDRQYPIELNSTAEDDDTYEIEIPPGYAVDDVPEPKKLDSSFASYQSHFDVSGSTITYKRTFINRALEIPTDKIAEFRSFQNQIAEDENAVVVLKKVK